METVNKNQVKKSYINTILSTTRQFEKYNEDNNLTKHQMLQQSLSFMHSVEINSFCFPFDQSFFS